MVVACIRCGNQTTVSGKVTFANKTLASGMVAIVASDGKAHYGNIAADGSYSITAVAPGEARFTVASPNLAQNAVSSNSRRGNLSIPESKPVKAPPASAPPSSDDGWFPIPSMFSDPDRSGLKFVLTAGTNVVDLPLPASPESKR